MYGLLVCGCDSDELDAENGKDNPQKRTDKYYRSIKAFIIKIIENGCCNVENKEPCKQFI